MLAACLVLTSFQLRHWRNTLALFGHALAVTDGNSVTYTSFGLALEDQGKLDEAMVYYKKALETQPGCPLALYMISRNFAQ